MPPDTSTPAYLRWLEMENETEMYTAPKNDKTVMEAIKLQNNGHLTQAASKFQQAGNQYRNPDEKRALWDAAARARRIAASD